MVMVPSARRLPLSPRGSTTLVFSLCAVHAPWGRAALFLGGARGLTGCGCLFHARHTGPCLPHTHVGSSSTQCSRTLPPGPLRTGAPRRAHLQTGAWGARCPAVCR